MMKKVVILGLFFLLPLVVEAQENAKVPKNGASATLAQGGSQFATLDFLVKYVSANINKVSIGPKGDPGPQGPSGADGVCQPCPSLAPPSNLKSSN